MRKERKIINTNIRLNLCDEQERQAWILLISVTSIAVTGDVVRKYIPINLILLLGIINIVTMEIRIYYHDTNELY